MADTPKTSGADFVRSIVTDPANVPDVMRLQGYAGASSEAGHERLYLNADLSAYVEIPKDAVVHRAPASVGDPLGAEMLWVRQDAALKHKAAPAANALAHYFAGAIQAGQAGAADAQPVNMGISAICTVATPCGHSPAFACGHPTLVCHTPGHGCPPPPTPACPTHPSVCCGSPFFVCGHTPGHGCPPPPTPACHTPAHGCPITPVHGCPITPAHGCPTPACTIPPGCAVLTIPPHCPAPSVVCLTPACTHPPQCLPPSPLVVCTLPSPLVVCTVHTPPVVCFHTPACPIASFPACPPVSLGCPINSLACGPGFPGGHGGQF